MSYSKPVLTFRKSMIFLKNKNSVIVRHWIYVRYFKCLYLSFVMITSFSCLNFDLGICMLPELRETRITKNIGLVDLIFFSVGNVQTVESDLIGGVSFSLCVRCEQFWQIKLFMPTFLVPPRCPGCWQITPDGSRRMWTLGSTPPLVSANPLLFTGAAEIVAFTPVTLI
jgi:hypothetical protein